MNTRTHPFSDLIPRLAEPFTSIAEAPLDPLLERMGDAQVVLLGEASHGTSEFYRMRQRITEELIRKKGFNCIAVEADWPDAEHVDDYVRARDGKTERPREAFARFPTWMWRNHEVLQFVDWLRRYNQDLARETRVSFHGLDLYSLYGSIHEVLDYFAEQDPEAHDLALHRYRCLLHFEPEPQAYGSAVLQERYHRCEDAVVEMLRELIVRRLETVDARREKVFDAEQNARVVANAENYYRTLYHSGRESWNIRDKHMFETLSELLEVRGPEAKVVVWAHNSHIGDAGATEMSRRGETNLGAICRRFFGDRTYLVGFGTHRGTVAAADDWGAPVEVKSVRPSLSGSFERLCHEAESARFMLPLRRAVEEFPEAHNAAALERAIGVIYRPQTERQSHYFETILSRQFDEWIWFDETHAVKPLERSHAPDLPKRHPFLFGD